MSTIRPPGSIPSFDQRAWWGPRADLDRLSIVSLIRAGTVDADLAALVWLLLEARVPLVVAAGPQRAGKSTLLTALLAFLPPTAVIRELEGYAEQFEWLPEARKLGWQAEPSDRNPRAAQPADTPASGHDHDHHALPISPTNGFLVANEFSPHLPFYTWGEQARIAVRALSLGYGLGTTIHADSLQDVFDTLRAPDVRLVDDELSRLGVVLVLRAFRGERAAEPVRRVVAAHYVRPVSRDAGGHVQRLAPAVLSTWDAGRDAFEHFAWGVTPELAERVGRRVGDFDSEHERRRDLLSTLAAAGVDAFTDVATAIQGYRLAAGPHHN